MQLALKQPTQYSYADYLTWDDDERWEIINGFAYCMSPAPSRKHQSISVELEGQILNFLKAQQSRCEMYHAPFDVRFPESVHDNEQIIDVVQPDISVICDLSKLDDRGCHGAPDWIIEILSPSTAQKDHDLKRQLYEKNNVQEYWLVDPTHESVIVYRLIASGAYGSPTFHIGKGKVEVKSIADLTIEYATYVKTTNSIHLRGLSHMGRR
jgi:Uma2 family endonuclease